MVFAAIKLSKTQTSVCGYYRGHALMTEKEIPPFPQPFSGWMVTMEPFPLIGCFQVGKKNKTKSYQV